MLPKYKIVDGWYEDEEGVCHGRDLESWIVTKVMGWCGCGNPDKICITLLEHLETIKNYEIEGGDLVLRYVLDEKGFIEHGGSVYGSWLTKDGEELLALLKEWNNGYQDN